MSHVDDVARAWRALVLGGAPAFLGGPEGTPDAPLARQQVYRRLVRNNLVGVVTRACPHARRLAGEDVFAAVVDRWLDEQPPTTRLVRDVPLQFAAWLAAWPAPQLPHPAFAELCHFESLEIDVTLAETARQRGDVVDPLVVGGAGGGVDERAVVVLDPAARLAVYAHPVHRVTATTTQWPTPTSTPSILLCFQQAEAFVVAPLSPALARVLVQSADGVALGLALDDVAAEAASGGVAFDRARVRADLVDLYLRGAVAGIRRPPPP